MRTTADIQPTRLQEVVRCASVWAQAGGRATVSPDDLYRALSMRQAARRLWKRRTFALDMDAQSIWQRAATEAIQLGHPYLAPEHLQLITASAEERVALLQALGTPFGRQRWWHPRGPHSMARPTGRTLIEQRRFDHLRAVDSEARLPEDLPEDD